MFLAWLTWLAYQMSSEEDTISSNELISLSFALLSGYALPFTFMGTAAARQSTQYDTPELIDQIEFVEGLPLEMTYVPDQDAILFTNFNRGGGYNYLNISDPIQAEFVPKKQLVLHSIAMPRTIDYDGKNILLSWYDRHALIDITTTSELMTCVSPNDGSYIFVYVTTNERPFLLFMKINVTKSYKILDNLIFF